MTKDHKPVMTWSEFKRLSGYSVEDIEDKQKDMSELVRRPGVKAFMEALVDHVGYKRFEEVDRLYQDPNKKPRDYCAALREIETYLIELMKEVS